MDYRERYDHAVALMKELGESSPAMMSAFMRLHGAAVKDGALSARSAGGRHDGRRPVRHLRG